jgi:zinc carboxypeptidase
MNRRAFLGTAAAAPALATAAAVAAVGKPPADYPGARQDYFVEPDEIPPFWITWPEDVFAFLDKTVRKGNVVTIGNTAGGRPIRAVIYGEKPRREGTTTFSGSLGFRDVRAYRGPDYASKVFMGMGSVHGGEFEGIAGIVNLVSALETGRDLMGNEWPEIGAAAERLDRIILVPVVNVDGRTRIPLRMMRHWGRDHTTHEYLNTGGKKDGTLLGWPDCKEFIPLDFSQVGFPGGYPNDAGVNVQHDDFLGRQQPETRALMGLTARERPDVVLNMHTGTQFIEMLRPFSEPALQPVFDALFRQVHGRLAREGLQSSGDVAQRSNPERRKMSVYNLDTALNLNCGGLSITVESPSHNYSTGKRNGEEFTHTPEMIVRAHLLTHAEAMGFVAESGGRST